MSLLILAPLNMKQFSWRFFQLASLYIALVLGGCAKIDDVSRIDQIPALMDADDTDDLQALVDSCLLYTSPSPRD